MTEVLREQLVAAGAVGNVLDSMGVAYLIGGSVASSMLGFIRSTIDVDLVADLSKEHARPLVDALSDTCYINSDAVSDAIRRRSCFNVIHLETAFKVDVFAMRRDPLSQLEMQRRQFLHVPGHERPIPVASPEDIVIQKLHWYRDGGEVSERQWNDVQGVLKVNRAALDLEYLTTWCGTLDMDSLLAKALDDAGYPKPPLPRR